MENFEELIRLQKQGHLVIVPCDKTGGFAAYNMSEYIEKMMEILRDSSINSQGRKCNHYVEVGWEEVIATQLDISQRIARAQKRGEITEFEMTSMIPSEATVGRLYGLCKDHKKHDGLPPLRPIAASNGTMTENIGKFVDHHSRKVVNKIWSHVDDTGDFLRKMETFKQEQGVIADDIFPVSIDVEKLYPSIPLEEGIQFFKEALDKCNNGGPSSNFLVELLEMVMRNNLVEFNKKFYRQKLMRGVKALLKYILGILLKGREIVNHSTVKIKTLIYFVAGIQAPPSQVHDLQLHGLLLQLQAPPPERPPQRVQQVRRRRDHHHKLVRRRPKPPGGSREQQQAALWR